MPLTKEEAQFVEFLGSFPQFYKKAHEIAQSSKGVSILPMENGVSKHLTDFIWNTLVPSERRN